MTEAKTYTAALLALLVLSLGSFQTYEFLTTPSYKQCREGRIYGEWLPTDASLVYKCDLTQEDRLCWKTTKTRCYLFDEEAIKGLDVDEIVTPGSQPVYENVNVEKWDCPKRPAQCIPG